MSEGMLEDVRWGLSQPQKQLPSKYFYDTRGSELFEAITELPEYYPTRTETGLLKTPVSGWVTEMAPSSLVELGAGSARKTRILLAAMAQGTPERTYAPVDVAGEFLRATAESLRVEDPTLDRPGNSWGLDFVGDLPRSAKSTGPGQSPTKSRPHVISVTWGRTSREGSSTLSDSAVARRHSPATSPGA